MIKQQAVKLTNTCGGADENAHTHVCNPAECQSIVKYDCMCTWVNIHTCTHTHADIHRHTHDTYAHHTHTTHTHRHTHTQSVDPTEQYVIWSMGPVVPSPLPWHNRNAAHTGEIKTQYLVVSVHKMRSLWAVGGEYI